MCGLAFGAGLLAQRGHPFDEANTERFGPDGRYRRCRTCRQDADRETKRRKYAALRPNGLAARRLAGR